jgi:hypothetical protein
MKKHQVLSQIKQMLTGRKQSVLNRTVSAATRLEAGPVGEFLLNRQTQMVIDALVSSLALVLSYLLRFDGWPPPAYSRSMILMLPAVALGRVVANSAFGIYQRIWRYASIPDAVRLAASCAVVSGALLLLRVNFVGIPGANPAPWSDPNGLSPRKPRDARHPHTSPLNL